MRPFRLIACLLIMTSLMIHVAAAQVYLNPVYIPLVTVPEPPIPPPDGLCAQNAPAPVEGAQAWVTHPYPAQRSDVTLCVRLVVQGRAVFDAPASAVVHYKTTDRALGPVYTGTDGIAEMNFNIGGATIGYTVWIDAAVSSQGHTYTAQTAFTPQ